MKPATQYLFVCTLFIPCSLPATAASFDCAKSSTGVERRICANSELSELDQQLGHEYQLALKVAKNPTVLRKAQKTWLEIKRSACDYRDTNAETIDYCLKPVYQRRIIELRSLRTPIDQVLGVYTNRKPNCFFAPDPNAPETRNTEVCEGFNEDSIVVQRNEAGAIEVVMELFFFNGHVCTFGGLAEWKQGKLVAKGDDEDGSCTIELYSDGQHIFTSNALGTCSAYCGMRGDLSEAEASKQ